MPPLIVPTSSHQLPQKDQAPLLPQPQTSETAFDRDHPPTKVAQEGPRPIMPRNNGLLDSALHAPLHAMDCIDVLIGAVRDGRTRVQDSYSRDRSTPLEDHMYRTKGEMVILLGNSRGGSSWTDERLSYCSGRSNLLTEIEPTDHPLGPGRMFVVWAKGQDQGAYAHGAPSALEASNSKVPFYMDDILKYHGSKNRGVHPIDFTTPVKLPKPGDAAFGVNIAAGEPAHHHQQSTALPRNSPTPASSTTATAATMAPPYLQEVDDSSSHASSIVIVLVTALIVLN
ncbi:hypothetical protein OSTOST_07411, partial [Ostertagia ostertagi]